MSWKPEAAVDSRDAALELVLTAPPLVNVPGR